MFLKIICNINAYNMNIKISSQENNDKVDVNNCSITGVILENNKFKLVFAPTINHLL